MTIAPEKKPAAPPKPKLPGPYYVACQAKRDWFGKDVQETPTVSYVWTADQFGHFGLGFQITFLLVWIAAAVGGAIGTQHPGLAAWLLNPAVAMWFALGNIMVWVVKEVFDYLRERRKATDAKSVFAFNQLEIIWNVITAVFYIALGAIVVGFAGLRPIWGVYAVLGVFLPAMGVALWWLRRKITFQQAGLSYLYRLATFPNEVPRETAEFIVDLSKPYRMNGEEFATSKHLVISGPVESGKSSLAIGIGTEFAFRMGVGRYITLIQLLQAAILHGDAGKTTVFDDGRILWPWENSDLLIVDDVDIASELILKTSGDGAQEQQAARARLTALKERVDPELLEPLKYRRTVWVLGDVHGEELKNWRGMIAFVLGVLPQNVTALELLKKIEDVVEEKKGQPQPTKAEQVAQFTAADVRAKVGNLLGASRPPAQAGPAAK